MPTYDYVCTACGRKVELIHSLHGHGPSTCSECGGAMKKSFAPPTVHFKGSGWARKEKSGRSPAGGKSRAAAGAGEASGASEASAAKEASGAGEASGTGEASGASKAGSGSAAEAKPAGDGR